jgi:hypothetical protein
MELGWKFDFPGCERPSLLPRTALSPFNMPSKRLIVDSDDENNHSYPEALFDSVRDEEWTSPAKKQKSLKTSRKPGQKQVIPRRDQSKASENGSRQANTDSGWEEEEEEVRHHFHDAPDPHLTPTIMPIPEISELALATFVDAVHSYSAGFYHLENNLFVVQGYDVARSVAQVHPFFNLHENYVLPFHHRISGTTWNTSLLRVPSMQRVPALQAPG